MNKLADFAIKNKIDLITSWVSSKDKRAMNFYKSCGFRKYAKYYMDKNFMLYRLRAKPEWVKEAVKKRTSN